jgi:hypothetical protein
MKNSAKKEKFEPTDSDQKQVADNKSVKNPKDKLYNKKDPAMGNPAKKREYSEQPPSKQNTHS